MSDTAPETILVWELEPGQHSVFSRNGRRVTLPEAWVFVPSGDPGLTRRLKAAGPCWQVVHNRRGRQEGIGLCVPQTTLERERRRLEDERADPAYERRLEAGRRARAAKQTRYEAEFLSAVQAFLAFAPRWRELGERLAAVALAHVYDEPVQADAPRLARAGLAGEKLTLRFVCTGGGLDVPEGGLPSLRVEGAALKRLCGCGDALVLTLEAAGPTVRVRYAQENWPEAVLMGENGLPVFPFNVEIARS